MNIWDLQKKLHSFELVSVADAIIKQTSSDLAALNRKQLRAGIRSTGTEIKPDYAPYTILVKDQKGQPTDRVTLEDTGEFYASIYPELTTDGYQMSASDRKTPDLLKKYGKTILGLTKENRDQYVMTVFLPELREAILQKIGLKFE